MKRIRVSIICILFFFLLHAVYAQSNLGFEKGNFTDWTGYTWIHSTDVTSINTSPVQGIVSRRHTIITDTTAYDANTGFKLRMVPKGYKYSVRLGDEIRSGDTSPRCWQQSLRYTMTVDSSNALLIFKYACVLEYATNHTEKVEARFKLTLYDKDGNEIPDCSNYDVYASNSYVKGFNIFMPASVPGGRTAPVNWRDWTTVGANLIKYLGQKITIDFMATDCTGRFHYGYAYFVADCQPLNITVKYCAKDSVASLTAPQGFETYKWTSQSGSKLDSVQILKVATPVEGEIYTSTMVSATGCTVSLNSTINKYVPKADFSAYMVDCKNNTVQFTNLSATNRGALQYKWIFEDSVTSLQKNPRYKFKTSGLHPMKLIVRNPPSSCVDTIKKVVESFSPPLVGISGDSTYCPGQSTYLKAYGAYRYDWNTGSKADSIKISDPGGKFWLLGHSSTGCVSDTIYRTVYEEPDWEFIAQSDTTLCTGDTTMLSITGPAKYLWNTGDTVNSILVNKPGTYHVVAVNKRGCKKQQTFEVREYPIPSVDFTSSPVTINSKNNLLNCIASYQDGVNFLWNMGDGTYEAGWSITHDYTINNNVLQYNIKLTATSDFGCIDSASAVVKVVPFIPNVFSPNGDGINDIFMAGLDLRIFDRNGLLLYRGTEGWDGKYQGNFVDPDTYFYTIQYSYDDKQVEIRKGYLTLIR